MSDSQVTKTHSWVDYQDEKRIRTGLDGVVSVEATWNNSKTFTNSITGSKNPHYRSQIRKGQNATTYREGTKQQWHTRPWYNSQYYNWTWRNQPALHYAYSREGMAKGYNGTPTVIDFSVPSELLVQANNEAISNVVTKMRAAQTAFQGGTFLGELADSIRALKSPARSLRDYYRRYIKDAEKHAVLVRRSLRSPRKRELAMIRAASDTWLEYSLGMVPLVSESRNAISAIIDAQDKNKRATTRVTGFGEREFVYSYVRNAYRTQCQPGFQYDDLKTGKVLVKYIAGIGAESNAAGYAAKMIGVHPSNWLPTAWELVPYSFVIDYFTNVGNIIDAWSIGKSSVAWGCKVVRYYTRSELRNWVPTFYAPVGSGSYGTWTITPGPNSPGACVGSTTKFERTSYDAIPVPSLEFNLPWSGTQWITLGSLVGASSRIRRLYRI